MADSLLQGLPFQQLHDDEGAAIKLGDVVNCADVRVIQSGSSARLSLKTAERQWVMSDPIRQELERHEAVQAGILGFVNHTHSATAQLLDDAVMG